MKVQVEEISPIEKKLSIQVDKSQVATELDRAYQSLSRQVKIAGFRPGKVPRRILEQRFKEQVEDDVVQRVVSKAYLEAIRQHDVAAVSQPTVTNSSGLKADADFSFEARVEVKPKLDPQGYQGLELKKVDAKVEDAQVDEQLDRMRKTMTRLEPIEGRDVAQANDYAVIDYTGSLEGKEFSGGKAENITVQVAPGELIEGKIAGIEGMKVGSEKTIDYAFPKDYGTHPRTGEVDAEAGQLAGKVANFKVALKALKTEIIPELNDEFAKEVGGGETLNDLKGKVRVDLERAALNRSKTEEREGIIKALVEKNPFEVPKAMVERAVDMMLEGALRQLQRTGLDPRHLQLDFNSLREEMRPRALTEVKGTLLLEAISEKEKVEASDADVEKKLEEIAEEAKQALSTVRKAFRGDQLEGLKLRLREEKTVEFLKARAKYS